MTIFLLRHGRIEYGGPESDNPKRFLGQTDTPLSHTGRAQARRWQTEFSDKNIERIYASDLARCSETARIIAGEQPAKVKLLPALREIHLGNLEGLSMDFARTEFPDAWNERGNNLLHYRPEGGESFADVRERVLPVFESITRRHEGNIMIVAHAGVNRIILCHILGMPVSNLFRIIQSPGCLNVLEPCKDFFRVICLNRACPIP